MKLKNQTQGGRLRFRNATGNRAWRRSAAFTLVETAIAISVVAIGLLGSFGAVLQTGKMAAAAEEEALGCNGLDTRVDQLRLLDWNELTNGSGIVAKVWTARPASMAGVPVTQETVTLSPATASGGQTVSATWNAGASPSVSLSGGTPLADAGAVRVVTTLTWTGRRSSRTQTRSLMTIISRGGISKSELP